MQLVANMPLCAGMNNLQLRFYGCGHAKTGAEWRANVVNPSFARLYFILGGDGRVNGRSLTPGQCYLFPTGHTFQHDCATNMEQLYFHIALTRENGQDVLRFIGRPLSCGFDDAAAHTLISHIQKGSSSPPELLLTQALVLQAISGLFELHGISLSPAEYAPCVENALRYIHDHPSASLTLEEVTRHSFASQTTLSKYFRREVGISVCRYIDDVVFARAQQLLSRKELSIAEISEILGFCDQFYFSRRFRQRYQEGPARYRKSIAI